MTTSTKNRSRDLFAWLNSDLPGPRLIAEPKVSQATIENFVLASMWAKRKTGYVGWFHTHVHTDSIQRAYACVMALHTLLGVSDPRQCDGIIIAQKDMEKRVKYLWTTMQRDVVLPLMPRCAAKQALERPGKLFAAILNRVGLRRKKFQKHGKMYYKVSNKEILKAAKSPTMIPRRVPCPTRHRGGLLGFARKLEMDLLKSPTLLGAYESSVRSFLGERMTQPTPTLILH